MDGSYRGQFNSHSLLSTSKYSTSLPEPCKRIQQAAAPDSGWDCPCRTNHPQVIPRWSSSRCPLNSRKWAYNIRKRAPWPYFSDRGQECYGEFSYTLGVHTRGSYMDVYVQPSSSLTMLPLDSRKLALRAAGPMMAGCNRRYSPRPGAKNIDQAPEDNNRPQTPEQKHRNKSQNHIRKKPSFVL